KAGRTGAPQPLPAGGAAGLFAGIVGREGAVILHENRRQRDELEQEALARVRAGVGRDYLAYAEKRERLVVSDSPVTTRARLLADWWAQARDDLPCNVMVALRRLDVADLNQLARQLMDTDGRLGKERLRGASRPLRRRGAAAGVAPPPPLPRPRATPPLRHRHPARTRKPLPRARRA